MRFETCKTIIDTEKEEAYDEGDVVTITFYDGGVLENVKITKITDSGFHFDHGEKRYKSVLYKDIADILMC